MIKLTKLLLVLMMGLSLQASIHVDSVEAFNHAMRKGPLAIVLFCTKQVKSPQEHMKLQGLFHIFHSIEDFNKQYITFIVVNVDKVPAIAQQFNITQLPTILLFKDGMPLMKNGKQVGIKGYAFANSLLQLVDAHFGPYLKQMMMTQEEYRIYRHQMRAYFNRMQGFNPYWCDYWGWPAEAYYPAKFGLGLCDV